MGAGGGGGGGGGGRNEDKVYRGLIMSSSLIQILNQIESRP